MSGCCICNFFKRTFLYQILIIIASLKLRNAFRYNRDFYERVETLLSSISLEKLINYLPKNKEYTHKGFLITIIVFASFSMLNVTFFQILSGISCILLAFLYHNPIFKLKELFGKKMAFNWENIEQNLPELEFILYICIAFAMFGNAFSQKTCQKGKGNEGQQIREEEKIEEETKEEKKVEDNKKNKPSNKNKKGKSSNKKKKE